MLSWFGWNSTSEPKSEVLGYFDKIQNLIDKSKTGEDFPLTTSLYGDNQVMQAVQKRDFDGALNLLNQGVPAKKDLCRFTATQMALLVGATPEQLAEFIKFDNQWGNNDQTRCANGTLFGYHMAANMANQAAFDLLVNSAKMQSNWQTASGYLNRTVAHSLCIRSFQTLGMMSEAAQQARIEMAQYLLKKGVRFDVPDFLGNTATDYAAVYFPYLLPVIAPGMSVEPKNMDSVPDFWGNVQAMYTVMMGTLDELKTLFEEGKAFFANGTNQTPLHTLVCMIMCMLQHI